MTRSCSIKWACFVLGTCFLTVPLAAGQPAKADRHGFIAAQPEDLRPLEGASQVVLFGDPTKRYVFHPANGHHFDGARDEEVTVQITGMGPVTSTSIKSEGGRGQR